MAPNRRRNKQKKTKTKKLLNADAAEAHLAALQLGARHPALQVLNSHELGRLHHQRLLHSTAQHSAAQHGVLRLGHGKWVGGRRHHGSGRNASGRRDHSAAASRRALPGHHHPSRRRSARRGGSAGRGMQRAQQSRLQQDDYSRMPRLGGGCALKTQGGPAPGSQAAHRKRARAAAWPACWRTLAAAPAAPAGPRRRCARCAAPGSEPAGRAGPPAQPAGRQSAAGACAGRARRGPAGAARPARRATAARSGSRRAMPGLQGGGWAVCRGFGLMQGPGQGHSQARQSSACRQRTHHHLFAASPHRCVVAVGRRHEGKGNSPSLLAQCYRPCRAKPPPGISPCCLSLEGSCGGSVGCASPGGACWATGCSSSACSPGCSSGCCCCCCCGWFKGLGGAPLLALPAAAADSTRPGLACSGCGSHCLVRLLLASLVAAAARLPLAGCPS